MDGRFTSPAGLPVVAILHWCLRQLFHPSTTGQLSRPWGLQSPHILPPPPPPTPGLQECLQVQVQGPGCSAAAQDRLSWGLVQVPAMGREQRGSGAMPGDVLPIESG